MISIDNATGATSKGFEPTVYRNAQPDSPVLAMAGVTRQRRIFAASVLPIQATDRKPNNGQGLGAVEVTSSGVTKEATRPSPAKAWPCSSDRAKVASEIRQSRMNAGPGPKKP